jgi:hypothetical protein
LAALDVGTLHGAPFAGLVDLVAAADGALWPFAEPLAALPARFVPPRVTPDGARVAAFDAAEPVERSLIAAVGFSAYRRTWLNRKRRLLLAALAMPGFERCAAALRRALAALRRRRG